MVHKREDLHGSDANITQNDRVLNCEVAPARLLKDRKHFSQSVMVSLAVSKLGKTEPFFYSKSKVNSVYYCDEVLARGLLRDIRQLPGVDGYIFQQDCQDGAPVSRNRVSVLRLSGGMYEVIPPDGLYRYRVSGGINHFYLPSCEIIPRGIKLHRYKVLFFKCV